MNLIESLDKVIADDDWSAFDEWSLSNTEFSFDYHSDVKWKLIPDNVINVMTLFMSKDEIISSNESWKLLYFLCANWMALSCKQKDVILSSLSVAVDNSNADLFFNFQLMEVLGRYYKNQEAFDIILKMKSSKNEKKVLVSATGLYLLSAYTEVSEIFEKSKQTLEELSFHRNDEVRDEAQSFLSMLGSSNR